MTAHWTVPIVVAVGSFVLAALALLYRVWGDRRRESREDRKERTERRQEQRASTRAAVRAFVEDDRVYVENDGPGPAHNVSVFLNGTLISDHPEVLRASQPILMLASGADKEFILARHQLSDPLLSIKAIWEDGAGTQEYESSL